VRNVDFVLYTSKLCNLRCAYCYELPLLSDKTRMSLEQVERLFTHVRTWLDERGEPVWVRFQWHGGEPLLIPPSFYWEAIAASKRIFAGSTHRLQHTVQTNLTVLDDERLDLLRNGFDAVGVSLDVFSGLRVDAKGADQEHRTLANLDRLLAAGVGKSGVLPSGISVVSRRTAGKMRELYGFYRSRRMGFRVLPLEKGMYTAGQEFELAPREILAALMELTEIAFADDDMIRVEPMVEHIQLILAARSGRPIVHDKNLWEPVLSVDTDGKLFGYTNYLDEAHALGNVFTTPLGEIMNGQHRRRQIAASEARVASICTGCEYRTNGCTTLPIAESEVSILEPGECSVVRPYLRFLERKLVQAGVLDETGALTPAMKHGQEEARRVAS
jgi:uncharacterized protein